MASKKEIQARQSLLYLLGYYVGDIDGDWGTLSKTACKSFQKAFGLTADGICGTQTLKALKHAVCYGMEKKAEETKPEDFWDEIEYFSRSEFACTCGGKYCNGFPVEPDEDMVRVVNQIRKHFGVPFTPNSAIRCATRNAEVGGVSNSQHLYGTAVDISIPGVSPQTAYNYADSLMPNTGGVGVYSWGIHVDSRKTKSRWKE